MTKDDRSLLVMNLVKHKKENKFSFKKKLQNEGERENRMAVLTELGEGQSAGLGLGHNSDVRIFRL